VSNTIYQGAIKPKMYNSYKIILSIILLSYSVYAQSVISVLYFDNTTSDEDHQWLSKGLADMLISDLNDIAGIRIIERASLEKILQEQALSLTGLTQEGTIEVGQLLQADHLVYGAYIINDDEIRIDMKLGSVTSGAVVYGTDIRGDIDDIFELEAELVSDIQEYLKLGEQLIPRKTATQSIDALANYYTGIDHLDHKRYTEAQAEFKKATELDPLFVRAQDGLAESYKFLKAFKKHRQQREVAALYAKINTLKERIYAPQWLTFADIVQSPQYRTMTTEQQQHWNDTHNEYLICNTPAQCTWHIMLTLDEIARKSAEYFNDTVLQKKLWLQIVEIGEDSRKTYASDSFLSELLYSQLLAYYNLNDYAQLKPAAEEFLMTYPDYRLVEAVENWYEKALEKLSGEK
jgi:TolB-like protein